MTDRPNRLRAGAFAAGIAALFAAPAAAQEAEKPAAPKTGESFFETFDSLDKERWYISDGWSNGDHQNCTWSRKQVAVEGGTLRLTFDDRAAGDRENVCGEVQTKARFGYGVYEIRMKAAEGSGLNSGFFTYIGPVHKQPHDEIDFEVLGKDPSQVQVNYYVDGKNGHVEKLVPVEGGAANGFNDYAFVWEEDRIAWYVNGELVHEVTDAARLPSHASKIYMSLWGSDTLTSWMGRFVTPPEPKVMEVDHVAFTAPGEECQFPGSIVCTMD
jgi:endo-1,3-1,4-beta-glycanase ExoK